MKSLVEFITEAISKSDITSNAKEVDDLKSVLSSIGLKKTRIAKWSKSAKKILGTNKSLYVISTYGTEKSNLDALKKIIDKGQIRRDTSTEATSAKEMFEITPVDYAASNVKNKKLKSGLDYYLDSEKAMIFMKAEMKANLSKNAYIKKVGITDDIVKQVEDIFNKYKKEFNDASSDGSTWFVKDDEGDTVMLFPSLFVVGKTVIKSVCIGNDMTFGQDRYIQKMEGSKFTFIFAKEDIDNLSNETE